MGRSMGQLGLRHTLARERGKAIEINREIAKLHSELERIQRELTCQELEAAQTAKKIAQLSAALTTVYQDAPESVQPRQTFPKHHRASWGRLTRTVLEILRAANGGPLMKSEIAEQLAAQLGIDLTDTEVVKDFSVQLQKTLKNMAYVGYLQRLHAAGGNSEGIWELKASSE